MNDRTNCVHIFVNRFSSDQVSTLSRIFVNNQLMCFGLEKHGVDAIHRIPIGSNIVLADWDDVTTIDTGINNRLGRLKIINPHFPSATITSSKRVNNNAVGSLILGTTLRAIPTKMRIIHSELAFRKLFALVATAGKRNLLRIVYRDSYAGQETAQYVVNTNIDLGRSTVHI